MGSPEISFSRMLDNDFGEPAETAEPLDRGSSTAQTQSAAPETMQVDEGNPAPYVGYCSLQQASYVPLVSLQRHLLHKRKRRRLLHQTKLDVCRSKDRLLLLLLLFLPLILSAAQAKSVLYHCDYCRKDITASVRIKCAVCTDFGMKAKCIASFLLPLLLLI